MIEWCHLIRDVLNKSSAETLLAGMNPGPLVEIEFWGSRCADLESVEDQVCTHAQCENHMHSIVIMHQEYKRNAIATYVHLLAHVLKDEE